MTRRIELPVPLARFPASLGEWRGRDEPLSEEVQQIAGNDDFLNRIYSNAATGETAGLYVAYSARPRTMIGHRPQVCYTGAGWVHDSTGESIITTAAGASIECLVHAFHKAELSGASIVVVNYYVLNGVVTNREKEFAGVGWRMPNIAGDPAWYVAQVQISARSEASAKKLAAETAPLILDYLPDADGKVRAAETADGS
jgi:EpsI family protein